MRLYTLRAACGVDEFAEALAEGLTLLDCGGRDVGSLPGIGDAALAGAGGVEGAGSDCWGDGCLRRAVWR